MERAVAVEVRAAGHATYIFAPGDTARFVRRYAAVNKEDIRKNRDGAAESLGFIRRVMHGANPRKWLRELKSRAEGEPDRVDADLE